MLKVRLNVHNLTLVVISCLFPPIRLDCRCLKFVSNEGKNYSRPTDVVKYV